MKIKSILIVIIFFLNSCSYKSSMAKASPLSSEADYKSTNIDGNSIFLVNVGSAILFAVVSAVALKRMEDEKKI